MSTSSSATTVASGSTSTGVPPIVSYGLVSGLNTASIIQAELQPFQIPLNNLQSEESTLNSQISDYQKINTDLLALGTAAKTLALPSGWTSRSATSSNTNVATAAAAAGTPAGTVQFSVTQLAAANSVVSSGTASATSQIVTSNPDLLLSVGADQLGFSSLSSASGVTLGKHTFEVTQSSQAASVTGTADLSGGATVASPNDTLTVTTSTGTINLSIADGTYTSSGLLSAINSAISAAGATGAIQAGYDTSGHLILSTVDQGSSQMLQVSGGAASTLGLTSATATGTDAVVNVDGVSNTFSTVDPGATLTLNGANGAKFTAALAGAGSQQFANSSLITAGTVTATDVSTGSGSLADVVANINQSGTGIVASAVQTGAGGYVLQLSSPQTGTAGDLSIDPAAFVSSSLGTLRTAVAGQDAELQVGGSTGYSVTSQTNTFTGLLPGLSVTALAVSSTPVTVTVGNDANAAANNVQAMVDDANTVLADLQQYAGYNAQTKVGGPLMGSATLQDIRNEVQSVFASAAGTSGLGSAGAIGISLNSTGQVTFDQQQFTSAYEANPSQVESLFTQGGTFTPSSSPYTGTVSFSYASDRTRQGAYDLQVSQSASQAQDSGAVLSGGQVTAGETLTIGMGSLSASYTTSAGQSLTSIAAGLNTAFANQGMALSARIVNGGQQLQLVSTAYGSAAQFSVSSTSTASGTLGLTGTGSSANFSGTDVAGTINGVVATGVGQFLTAPQSDPSLAGLSVQVTASGITTATDLGTFTYQPGLAQALSSLASNASDPTRGSITETVQGLQTQIQAINPQISMYNSIVQQQQKLLMAKYATLESTLGTLKNQSSSLSAELSKISANSGS